MVTGKSSIQGVGDGVGTRVGRTTEGRTLGTLDGTGDSATDATGSVRLCNGPCDLVGVGVGDCATSLGTGRSVALSDGLAVTRGRASGSDTYRTVLPVNSNRADTRNRPSRTMPSYQSVSGKW
jgi:hypothetical protein